MNYTFDLANKLIFANYYDKKTGIHNRLVADSSPIFG